MANYQSKIFTATSSDAGALATEINTYLNGLTVLPIPPAIVDALPNLVNISMSTGAANVIGMAIIDYYGI
jgi:hypothetical protein